MEVFDPQTVSETAVTGDLADGRRYSEQDHDFLSFLSLFVNVVNDMSTDLHLAGLILGPAVNLKDPIGQGKFFSVTLVDRKDISENLASNLELDPLPEVVAIKVPILAGDANSPSNRRVFSSMATELQILRHPDILGHPNVVTLLGVCWQLNSDEMLLPVFVMEASEIGNLKVFLYNRDLTPLEESNFCIDVARGVRAIHEKGIIHGDIKPENILVFKDDRGSFTAKICDFGCSILVSTAKLDCQPIGGTRIWQAPEIGNINGPQDLLQADIYSLGLVLWYIFDPTLAAAVLDGDSTLLKDHKASGELVETVMETLESSSTDAEKTQLVQCVLSSTLACSASERWGMDAIIACLFEIRDVIELDASLGMRNLRSREEILGEPISPLQEDTGSRTTIRTQYIVDLRNEQGILDMTRHSATMIMLPSIIVEHMKRQLQIVADDNNQALARRGLAAYQYAMGYLQRLRHCYTTLTEVEKPLLMLQKAATFGNQQAQAVVNMLHETFGKVAPFTTEVEIPWLANGTINGSMTARSRLRQLDSTEYITALRDLRYYYSGVGIRHAHDPGKIEDVMIMHQAGVTTPVGRFLQVLSYLGDFVSFETVLNYGYYDINGVDAWGETALLVACRTGHAEIAKLLLRAGANPNIASNEDLTALHFLGAFDDDDIPEIAGLFVQQGADIEARSTSGHMFNSRIDCQFGVADGTPLLWAVGARSLVATKMLLIYGADPFDIKSSKLPVKNSWGANVHLSPIDLASLLHQHEFLELMLSHRRDSANDCALQLNSGFRNVAPHPNFSALPLFWALDYSFRSPLERLLLHGQNHKSACKKTIQTLISYGASTSEVDSRGRSALNVATAQGHLFLTAHLLQNDDPMNYDPRNMFQTLCNTARIDDHSSFTLLVRHIESKSIKLDDESVQYYYALTSESTDNTNFIDYYLDRHQWDSILHRDDDDVFERTILNGHFNTAQRIFERGHVNLTKRLYYGDGDYSTVFGRLLARAKKFKNALEKIEQFLSITGSNKEILFNVVKVSGTELTALQAVCLHSRDPRTVAASGPVVDIILGICREPRFLDAQVSGTSKSGWTALHFAIDGGNVPAVDRLLQAGISFNILNDQGESALDKVKTRWRNQDRFMVHVPLDERVAWKERHERLTIQLTNMLVEAGATCRRYWGMVRKLDENTVVCEAFELGFQDVMELEETEMLEFEALMPGIKQIAREMNPDHMFLIGMDKQTLNIEAEVESRRLARDSGGSAGVEPIRWGTGGCQVDSPSSSINASIGTSSRPSTIEREKNHPPLKVELISSPTSRLKIGKTALDHDLTDLCDWLRDHE